jgi:hypothetical protein
MSDCANSNIITISKETASKMEIWALIALLPFACAIPAPGQPGLKHSDTCTSTMLLRPDFDFGPTSTVYTRTTTTTISMDCGDCTSVMWDFIGFGVPPVVFFDATTTAQEPAVETAYACLARDTKSS